MEALHEHQLDRIFYALSDQSRRKMLSDMSAGSLHVKDLAKTFSFTKAATSKHLRVLEDAGLITKVRKGREVLCTLNPNTIKTADDWLRFYRQFWDERLDKLEELMGVNEKDSTNKK